MQLFTPAQIAKLRLNGTPENYDKDQVPVVKLFLPGTSCKWLLTQLDHEYEEIAFGLCDLGMGFPELGSVSLQELKSLTLLNLFKVERDIAFEGKYPISIYAAAARANRSIVEDEGILRRHLKPHTS